MATPNNQETTTPAVDEVVDTVASDQQSTDATDASAEADASAELDNSIPEKFRGKSALEIAREYKKLESFKGKIASEKAHREQELEESKARIAQLEAAQEAFRSQPHSTPQPQQQQQQTDPMSSFDESFEKDPAKAVKDAVKSLAETTRRTRVEIAQEVQAKSAADHYTRQMKDNPDFAANEKDMQLIARQYLNHLRPEVANTPEIIDLLYQLARARNMNRYIDEAVKKSKSAGDLVKDEKRRAFSESSNTQGESSVDFDKLSLDEMKAALGRADE